MSLLAARDGRNGAGRVNHRVQTEPHARAA
jgi:hypothetical protein